jgi:hypothetical protein
MGVILVTPALLPNGSDDAEVLVLEDYFVDAQCVALPTLSASLRSRSLPFGSGGTICREMPKRGMPLLNVSFARRHRGSNTLPMQLPTSERLVFPGEASFSALLAGVVTGMGHPISADTVRKELVKLGFSRQHIARPTKALGILIAMRN